MCGSMARRGLCMGVLAEGPNPKPKQPPPPPPPYGPLPVSIQPCSWLKIISKIRLFPKPFCHPREEFG